MWKLKKQQSKVENSLYKGTNKEKHPRMDIFLTKNETFENR